MILTLDSKPKARIKQRKQAMIMNNVRENKSRVQHKYKVRDKVLLTKPDIIPKWTPTLTGPHEILGVWPNGTVLIKRGIVQATP